MDFEDTEEEARFRAEVRDWLAENAQAYTKPAPPNLPDEEVLARGKAWQARKDQAGYGAILWPKAYGGRQGTLMESIIFRDEESRYFVPYVASVTIGLNMAVPTMFAHGTPDQLDRFVEPTRKGEVSWCQLFSEPGAGSDLAGLRTRAVKDGDDWVVTGQKVWTSWGHLAEWAILIARTDPSVPKHKGLTFFIVDMASPGIEVRPIRQISGKSEFNEVFLNEVRIPDANRIGEVNGGWKVTMTTLMNERAGAGGGSKSLPDAAELIALARGQMLDGQLATDDSAVRAKLARFYTRTQALKYFNYRMVTAVSQGGTPGPEAALGKLVYANNLQAMSTYAMELLQARGQIVDYDLSPETARFQDAFLWSIVMRIAGGTDEIVRNQLAERVLGLPGEIRMDKDVPFRDLKV